jgi:hypothetical protein
VQHILYLSAQSVIFHQLANNSVKSVGRYALNDSGLQMLRAALVMTRPESVCILADLIEEEFRLEKLPHTYGRDRNKLHARHRAKLFRGTPFRYSQVLGRSAEGRRDDIVSFSALTNRDNLEPLLALLEQTGIPLSGISALPAITPRLLTPLSATRGNVLVVTEQPDEGLRQTYVCNGQVRFSRLAPISESSPEQYCTVLDAETHKTRRYLDTLKLLPRNELLDVYAITDTRRVQSTQRYCRNEELLQIHPVSLARLAAHLGFDSCPDSRYSNLLYCYLAGKHSVDNQYAPPARLKNYNTLRTGKAMYMAAWLFAVAGSTWSGINSVDGLFMEDDTASIRAAIVALEARYRQVSSDLPMQPDEARAMHEAIRIAESLESVRTDLTGLFSRIGSAFARHPGLQMTKFNWYSANARNRQNETTPVYATTPSSPYVTATISGQLRHFDGNYRLAHATVENLIQDLKAQPGVIHVALTRTPLDTRESSEIQGELSRNTTQEEAGFDLEIVLETAHEAV